LNVPTTFRDVNEVRTLMATAARLIPGGYRIPVDYEKAA